MITVDDILTSSGEYPDRPIKWPPTSEMLADAAEVVRRVNLFLTMFGASRDVSSGYRPPEVNAATPGAAKNSHHMTCKAVDLRDKDGKLGAFALASVKRLEDCDLYLEHPIDTFTVKNGKVTARWVHLQIVPPRSKRRIFRK